MVDDNASYSTLKDWILRLPKVTESPHRFGGSEFQVDGLEFMHSHGASFLDIRLSKEDQTKALKNGGAIPHRFAPQAGWVSFRIVRADDVEKAKKIIQLAYDNTRRTMETHDARRRASQTGEATN